MPTSSIRQRQALTSVHEQSPAIPSCNTQALLIIMYKWPLIAGPLGAYFGTLGNGSYLFDGDRSVPDRTLHSR